VFSTVRFSSAVRVTEAAVTGMATVMLLWVVRAKAPVACTAVPLPLMSVREMSPTFVTSTFAPESTCISRTCVR